MGFRVIRVVKFGFRRDIRSTWKYFYLKALFCVVPNPLFPNGRVFRVVRHARVF